MLLRIRSRTTYANVMSTMAVFIALGGVSYAAVKLPKNSVGPAQIKKNAVTGSKVRNSSLTGADIRNSSLRGGDVKNSSLTGSDVKDGSLSDKDLTGALPAGPTGAPGSPGSPGSPGAQGARGESGAPGRSALTVLASGETVRGVIGARDNAGASLDSLTPYASLPIPAPVPLDDDHVNVDGQDDASAPCTGSAAEPTAPPGYVCVYPTAFSPVSANNNNRRGLGVPVAGGSRYGFRVAQDPTVPNASVIFEGVWAYTAP